MRFFDFLKTIRTKFINRELGRLPEAQYINSAHTENSIIHENAYINAYTKQFNTKPSNLIKIEENGRILKMKQNDTKMQVSKIRRLKQSLPVEDGRQIDLYSGILEKNEKRNIVYFGLENGVNLKNALEDKTRSYKVSNKMTKLFTIPVTKSSKFIGSLVEDDIYKNYCITKSPKLEGYVNKIEERRIKVLQERKAQIRASSVKTVNSNVGKQKNVQVQTSQITKTQKE